MAPCVGIPQLCPPLCKYHELKDGTYTLADVERFHQTMIELQKLKDSIKDG